MSGTAPVKIRLRRVGKKHEPSYRIVVASTKSPRDGAFIEQIGTYHPLSDPPGVTLDEEKALKWLRVGAQPSDGVQNILKSRGILDKVRQKRRS